MKALSKHSVKKLHYCIYNNVTLSVARANDVAITQHVLNQMDSAAAAPDIWKSNHLKFVIFDGIFGVVNAISQKNMKKIRLILLICKIELLLKFREFQ